VAMPTPNAPAPAPRPPRPSDILPEVLTTLHTAVAEGLSYPELTIQTKQDLGRLGIYGSAAENTPSATENWGSYRARRAQERALGRLATNLGGDMARVQNYDSARADNTLGLAMALAWTKVRAIRPSGVHITDPVQRKDETIDGTVTALVTTATFENEPDATMWHTMLQGTHNHSPVQHVVRPYGASDEWAAPEDPWSASWVPPPQIFEDADGVFVLHQPETPPPPQPHRVEVTNLTEYDRIVNEAISVCIRKELAEIGIVLPREKVPLDDWLKTTTLHPEIEKWLRAIDDTYRQMHHRGFVTADYISSKPLQPGRRKHITATDPAAASKVKRDEFNGLIHDRRGGDSRNNAEQNPNRNQRYHIERDVHLRRPKPPKPGQQYQGPNAARPLNPLEKATIEVRETWLAVRKNPKQRIPEILPELIGSTASKIYGGALDIGISVGVLLAKGVVASWKGVRNYLQDIQDFRQNKAAARQQLKRIYMQLRQLRLDIPLQKAPDAFPDQNHTLRPSPQLAVIKEMTAFMLERLSETGPNIADDAQPGTM